MSMRRIKEIKWGAAALALLAVGAGVGWWAHRMMQTPPAMSATHEAPLNLLPINARFSIGTIRWCRT